jgi:hypothetical protein
MATPLAVIGVCAGITYALTESLKDGDRGRPSQREMAVTKLKTYALLLVLVALNFAAKPALAHAPEIWMGPIDPVTRAAEHWDTSADFMDLFRPDAPWQTVAAHTKIFKIGPGFTQQGKEEDLKRIFKELQRRDIGLAVEMGLLTTSAHCPAGNEAYGPPGLVEGLLTRLKRLGADVRYVAMDEPLEYGHLETGANRCHDSIDEVARQVAINVAVVKRIFPQAHVGDSEVVGLSQESDVEKWLDAYQKAVGEPLAFLHADVAWSHHAMKNLVPLAAFLKSRRVPFGVIYNGGDVSGDEAWALETERHYDEIEGGLGIPPDAAVFHTWVRYPTRVLPENQAGTLTNIVLNYLRPAAHLSLQRHGVQLAGKLFTDVGPVANVSVAIEAIDVQGAAGLVPKHYSGLVPKNAAKAVIGVRINIEGSCACSGKVQAAVGTVQYREAGKPRVETFTLGGPQGPAKFSVTAREQKVAVNSRTFPVTAGAGYSVDFPISVTWDSENAGYVALIFLSRDGKQVGRDIWRFQPKEWMIATVQTDSSGAFHYEIPGEVARLNAEFRGLYLGNASLRSTLGQFR